MTLFIEPVWDCFRTAVPVAFLLTWTGMGLVWDDIAASISQGDAACLEMGKEVTSP